MTHLHVHSHFTLLGGAASVDELAERAAADGLSHLALTDTNALYGAVAFRKACLRVGIRPIIGMTVTVAPLETAALLDDRGPGLLVLLAGGPAGYRSLCRLSSLVQASPDRQTLAGRGLPWDALRTHSDGLICLSGGRRDWIERSLRAGDRQTALRYAGVLAELFGDQTYLSLELHRPDDAAVALEIAALGKRLGVPTVAVQPVYSLARQDRARLRLLAAIDQNCRLQDVPRHALPDDDDPDVQIHWLSPGEMATRFSAFPDALAAAAEVANRCGPALPDGRPIWPALKLAADESPDTALAALAEVGLAARFAPEPGSAVRDRLHHELKAIARSGFSPLFLVVADLVRYAREHDIPVSTRGSVANSLVAYCSGITTVDPIQHDLLFERFLSPARANPPDIDLDFCSQRRDRVLDYVRRTYGEDQVALVATISTMRPKSAVRETAKAYGLPDDDTERLIRLLPSGWHPDPRRRSTKTMEDVAAEIDDPTLRQVVLDATQLIGQPDHLSVHPGGIVITPGPLTDFVPVQWTVKGFLITQYDHGDVEAIGLPKIDLLGIRALTVLADAAELVRKHADPGFRLAAIPLDDPKTGDLLQRAETIGVFQCDSTGAQRTLRQLKARTVQDLATANAFFKPGPALGGMARTFVRRYRGEEPVRYLHPSLEPILGRTKGVLIFQEQILRIATEIAGLSWEQADALRRGMSHFGRHEMEATRDAFVTGCLRPAPAGHGLSIMQAQILWEQVLPFAGYGFNQGHATAYADVSYRSAYMKTHFPAEFFTARLADWGGFHHPAVYIAEAQRLGIAVRPPHINQSHRKFTLQSSFSTQHSAFSTQHSTLWMGLGQVRDLRQASVREIITQRRKRPFDNLRDLLLRVDLQAKEATHLVQCGALDGLGANRADLLAELQGIRRAGSVQQASFDFAFDPVAPESLGQRLEWESHLLGWPVSVTPMETLGDPPEGALPLADLPRMPGRPVAAAGYRLPGWTGGRGFFLSDGSTFVVVVGGKSLPNPKAWQPIVVQGRFRVDEWGTAELAASSWTAL